MLTAMTALLAACGGGGGGGDAPAPVVNNSPGITGLSPSSAVPGASITIAGRNFGATAAANTVRFSGALATVTAASATALTVTLPGGASTGTVTVQTQGGSATSSESFIVLPYPPQATSVDPSISGIGSSVTITGSRFSSRPSENVVVFNGVPGTVTAVTPTELLVTVPLGATSGPLLVRTFAGETLVPGGFTVGPAITGFSPGTAAPGERVTITGTNFGATDRVRFSGVEATVSSRSATQLVVVVPQGASTGAIAVRPPAGATALSSSTFNVNNGPSIERFTPTFGATGTTITIYGARFLPSPTANTVNIGGVAAPVVRVVTSSQPNSLVVTVPVGAASGFPVTVTTAAGTGTSSEAYTAAYVPPARRLALNPDPLLAFGVVPTGSYRFERVTVTNVGTAALQMKGASVAGAGFEFRGTNCYGYNNQLVFFDSLAPGASCYVEVGFNSTATGDSGGSVGITSNADGSPHSVGLSASGSAPLAAALSPAPASLTFAARDLGTVSLPQTVSLSNSGTAPLAVAGIGATGEFTQTHNCPVSLPAGTACTVSVSFAPVRRTGAKVGVLIVDSNAPGGLKSVPLQGTGTLSRSGQLAIYTREAGGIDRVLVDGEWAGSSLSPTSQNLCGGQGAFTLTLAPGPHLVSATDRVLTVPDATVDVVEGGCAVHRVVGSPACLPPNVLSGGVCNPPTPLTCVAPAVLQNGACATPGTTPVITGGGTPPSAYVGRFISSGNGSNAAQCLSFGFKKGSSASYDSQTITNTCSFVVYVLRCHTPSTRAGTASTQCNATGSGRFYQQFGWIKPGETVSNFYSLPAATTIWYGACAGGNLPSGKEVSLTGDYTCSL